MSDKLKNCKHDNLMRHEYHGNIWWQCENGCDFLARQPDSDSQRLREAAQAILDIGKRDMSNPKYEGYFNELRAALAVSALKEKK